MNVTRLVLPLLVLAAAVVLWLAQVKLVLAPVIMLSVWPYLLALVAGAYLTIRYHFAAGALAACIISVGVLAIFDFSNMSPELFAYAFFAPLIPLAILQLAVAPFQLRKPRNGV